MEYELVEQDDPYPQLTEALKELVEIAPSPWAIVSSLVNACYETPGSDWQDAGDALYGILDSLKRCRSDG